MYKLNWTDTHSYAQYSRKTPACRHIHFSTSSLILSSKLYKVQQEVANSGYICLGTSLPFPTYKSSINIIYQTLCNPFLSWIACCFYPWVVSMLVILPAIIKFIIKHLYYLGILLERSPNNKILVNSNTWLIISPFFHELFSKLLLLLTFLCITLKIILQTKKKNHRLHPYLKIYKELFAFYFLNHYKCHVGTVTTLLGQNKVWTQWHLENQLRISSWECVHFISYIETVFPKPYI